VFDLPIIMTDFAVAIYLFSCNGTMGLIELGWVELDSIQTLKILNPKYID